MTKARIVLLLITTILTLGSAHFTAISFDGAEYFNNLFPVIVLLILLLFTELGAIRTEQNFNKLVLNTTERSLRLMDTIGKQINTIEKLRIKIKELEG